MQEVSMIAEAARGWARRWLTLAVVAVAISGVFAILIALARVPALGTLFPGGDFYRVALVLHVNLSQAVWFMAFACVLWSLHSRSGGDVLQGLALVLAAGGTAGIVLAVSAGSVIPLMSNYLPVLESRLFLASLSLFAAAILLKALISLPVIDIGHRRLAPARIRLILLKLSVVAVLLVFLLLAVTAWQMPAGDGMAFFETLFWGPGHLWQFALIMLLMFCWLELVSRALPRLPKWFLGAVVLIALIPVALSLGIPLFHTPGTSASVYSYTWLMRWTSWQAPLLLGLAILVCVPRVARSPGFGLSLLLFVSGLLLGSLINGQTTLVTAHYHGTIGAITLAFMALGFRLLPVLGIEPPASAPTRWQLGFYGYGILLMMLGLAGAGLMGAPRKMPGDLALSFSVETFSRICLGIGGLCATIGIVMFAYLLLSRLLSAANVEAYSV